MGCEAMYDIMYDYIAKRVISHTRDFPTQSKVNNELRFLRDSLDDPIIKKNLLFRCHEKQKEEDTGSVGMSALFGPSTTEFPMDDPLLNPRRR